MKKSKRKRSVRLSDVVKAAHKAGAHVTVSLEPKQPVSTKVLEDMADDCWAIWLLTETRSEYGLECARRLLRRISFNEAQFCVLAVENELRSKPILERKVLP